MTRVAISKFSGVSPAIKPRYLRDDQAQTALNCSPLVGPLLALKGTTDIQAFSKAGDILGMYRFGQDIDSETQYWFHWTVDVDVVKGFISGDATERTFFTGDGVPKATDNTLALTGGGTDYPIASYMLGLPVPVTAPICQVTGTPDPGAVAESRVYTFTYVNSWGEESAPYAADPMPASTKVDVKLGETVDITLPVPPGGNYNITNKRIYRAVSGTYSVSYLFVDEIPAAQTAYNDSKLAGELGEECPSITWDPPLATLAGLVGLPNGILAAFKGHDVYLSDPYHPFAWPVDYMQSVGYKIVGLGSIDTTVVIVTQGRPYFLQGSDPLSMVLIKGDIKQSCVAKQSIVSAANSVIYASPDGLVAASPGGSRVVTEGLFDKEQWQAAVKPESIRAFEHEGRYYGFYDTGSVSGGFVFDPKTGSFIFHDIYATAGYADLKNDTLFLAVSNRLHKFGTGSALTYVWRSKVFTMPVPTGFSCFKVGAEAYPVTVKFYVDGVLSHTKAVPDNDIHRLPGDVGVAYEIEITGTSEIFSVAMAQTPDELVHVG